MEEDVKEIIPLLIEEEVVPDRGLMIEIEEDIFLL